MKKSRLLFFGLVLALILVAVPLLSAQAQDKMPAPIDPQSWTLLRDTNWSNYVPNPVIDWMTEHNPQTLVNPQGRGQNKISGAIILVDFWDKPFLMLGEKGADLYGWHAFKPYETYEDYLNKITRGDPVTKNPQRVVANEAELLKYWEDYLNKKLVDPALNTHNFGVNIDEFWRENSYGKWGVDIDAFGVFHLQGFELEYWDSVSNSSWNDIPPTFRRGASGTSGQRNFTSECIALASANGVYLGDYDFFFICHSGYDQSAIWMEFGPLQWRNGADVPYEYGVRAKMEELEKIITAHPEYLLSLDTRGGYNQSTTIRDEAAKVRAHQSAGTLSQYEFKFPAAEWNWANNYIGQGSSSSLTGTAGGPNTGPTRYVRWTSWAAMATRWAGAGSASVPRSPANGGGNVSRRYSQQGESNGMATYAHEFGHIVGLSDNYSNSYGATYSPDSEPWDLMARGCFAGPFGDHARWSVPGGLEADSAPVHLMMTSKKTSGFYDPGDVLAFTVADLKRGGPVVANIVARNIPLNNNGFYPQLEEYGLKAPNYYKAIEMTFDSANPDVATLRTSGFTWTRTRAGRMSVEVVQRTGYDSFAPDDGVVLSRLATGTGQGHTVVDSHLFDLQMADYYLNGEPVYYTMGNQAQLFDGAFKAGKSFVDTGYYKHGEYQWDPRPQDKTPISGNTVNEFHDVANKLHFYILEKHMTTAKYGDFLSYTVGVLHEDGPAVGGELNVKLGDVEMETPGRVAVASFDITNTGDAADIIRVGVAGLDAVLLNDLYAVGAGETVTVPVYVEINNDVLAQAKEGLKLTLTASSETNGEKVGAATVDVQDLVKYNFYVYLKTAKPDASAGRIFTVDVMLTGDKNYTQFNASIAYDAACLEYVGYENLSGLAAEVKKDGLDKISLRSVPSLNMLQGVPCVEPVRIATLKFKVKESPDKLATDLNIAAVLVTPTAGANTITAPCKPLPILINPFANKVTIPMDAHFDGKWQLFQTDQQAVIGEELGGRIALRAYYFTTEHDICGLNVYGDDTGRGGHYTPATGDIAAYNAQGQLTGMLATGNSVAFQWYIADKATNDPAEAEKLLYNYQDAAQGFVISNIHEVDTSAHFLGTKYYFVELTHTAPGNVVNKYYSAPVKVTLENSKYPPELLSTAEISGWRLTTLSSDLITFYKELEKQSEGRLNMQSTGWQTLGRVAAPANATNVNAQLYKPSPPQDIPVAIFSDPARPVSSPADIGDRLVALISGGPHSGEVEGKEAAMIFARELALGDWDDILKDVVVMILPSTNMEGNDMLFAQRNSGQYLPKLVGTRFSAGVLNPLIGAEFNPTNESHSWYNLNRDMVKLDTPEARVLTDIFNIWDPVLFIDLHGINGMMMLHAQTWNAGLHPDTDPAMLDYNRYAFADLAVGKDSYLYKAQNKTARLYGVNWRNDANHYRDSDNCEPRYTTNYIGLRNRLALLLECYSHDPYPVRTDTQYASLVGSMQAIQTDKAKISKMIADTEAWARGRAERGIDPDDPRDKVTLRGVLPTLTGPEYAADPTLIREMEIEAYRTNESTGAILSLAINDPAVRSLGITSAAGDRVGTLLAGLPATLYKANDRRYYVPSPDPDHRERYTAVVPLGAYYLFDRDCEGAEAILTQHGIEFSRLEKDITIAAADFQWFNAIIRRTPATYYEGRLMGSPAGGQTAGQVGNWVGQWTHPAEAQLIPAGTYVVSTAQPMGNLAALMLEPGCMDGLMTWEYSAAVKNPIQISFFDSNIGQKEGMIRSNFKSSAGEYYVPIFKILSFDAIK